MSIISDSTIKTWINIKAHNLKFTKAIFLVTACYLSGAAQAWDIFPGSGGDCENAPTGIWNALTNTCTVIDAVTSTSNNNTIYVGATLVVEGMLDVEVASTLTVAGGSLIISPTAEMHNYGTFTITDDITADEVQIEGSMENTSNVNNDGDFNIIGGIVENTSDGVIENTKNINIDDEGILNNYGTVINNSLTGITATITNEGRLTNTGTDNSKTVITNMNGSKIINKSGAILLNKSEAHIDNNTSSWINNSGLWLNSDFALVTNTAGILNEIDTAEMIFNNSILDHREFLVFNKGLMEFPAGSTYFIRDPATFTQFCSGVITSAGNNVGNFGLIVNFGGVLTPLAPLPLFIAGVVVDTGLCIF